MKTVFTSVIAEALSQAIRQSVPVYTFALYYDHESSAVSACIDTEENSRNVVRKINQYNNSYFQKCVAAGDLKGASLWQANVGRSLSLGNFSLVNVGRVELKSDNINQDFFVSMLQALVADQEQVAKLSPNREQLLFCCSSQDSEVGYVWSALTK